VVEAGEIFGEAMLFGNRRRQATAEVIEKASVMVIPGEAAASYAESHPEFWKAYSQQLGGRVQDLEEQVQWVTFLEVEQRIARLLLRWGESHPVNPVGRMQLHLSQRDVAGMVGATRETTSAALNRLRRDGCLSIGRRCLVVESVDKLAQHTGDPQNSSIEPKLDDAALEQVHGQSAGR
jgi:CRP/FNR family transcriptional regulator